MKDSRLQHGYDYAGQNIDGWLVSEKLDGCRLFWDGGALWTRSGLSVPLSETWRGWLPKDVPLDGEIYSGPGALNRGRCAYALRTGEFSNQMTFNVFDAPSLSGNWIERLRAAKEFIPLDAQIRVVEHWTAASYQHAKEQLSVIHARGGEGLMLRHPEIRYIPGRTKQLLKFKKSA